MFDMAERNFKFTIQPSSGAPKKIQSFKGKDKRETLGKKIQKPLEENYLLIELVILSLKF